MENNSNILGRIPGSGTGLNKTYIESTFIRISIWEFDRLFDDNIANRRKLYFDTKSKKIVSDTTSSIAYKELEVINLIPYITTTYEGFIAEVIRKDVLLRHLQQEKIALGEMDCTCPMLRLCEDDGK